MAGVILVPDGTRFGLLEVLKTVQEPGKNRQCVCKCDCGNVVVIWKHNLTSNHTTSCGCERIRAGKDRWKHGHAKVTNQVSPTYKTWTSMLWRVNTPEANPHYVGVTVCDRWRTFENFLADMGERPEGKTIDRIDPGGGYEPLNCRWATPPEQSKNRKPWKHTPEGLKKITRNLPGLQNKTIS